MLNSSLWKTLFFSFSLYCRIHFHYLRPYNYINVCVFGCLSYNCKLTRQTITYVERLINTGNPTFVTLCQIEQKLYNTYLLVSLVKIQTLNDWWQKLLKMIIYKLCLQIKKHIPLFSSVWLGKNHTIDLNKYFVKEYWMKLTVYLLKKKVFYVLSTISLFTAKYPPPAKKGNNFLSVLIPQFFPAIIFMGK